jgi:biopolymer transport protein TolR
VQREDDAMSAGRKKRGLTQGLHEANITPLADVTTTLIVVFLITMPAIMWNGIQVNQAQAGSETAEVQPTEIHDDELVTVAVNPEGIQLNGRTVTPAELEAELPERLARTADRTVVIVPHDDVELGQVVEVLDIAKASGASSLALLNEIGG